MDRTTKLRVFTKLLAAGFDNEEVIKNFELKDIKKAKLTLSDVEAVTELQEAIKNRKVISYFACDEEEKEGDAKAAGSVKSKTDAPQKEAVSKDAASHNSAAPQVPGNSTFYTRKE